MRARGTAGIRAGAGARGRDRGTAGIRDRGRVRVTSCVSRSVLSLYDSPWWRGSGAGSGLYPSLPG